VPHDSLTERVGTVHGVPWPVAVILTGEGTGDASALAERVSAWLEPRMLFVVGVAGSLKKDVTLGDVVVATWVYGYHGGKEDKTGFHARPRTWRSHHRLTQAAGILAAIGNGWAKSLESQPSVHLKPIAAGDVVLNSRTSPLRQQLREHYNDAVAIEMESAGVMAAAGLRDRMPVLTVRGISDLADGRKHLSDQAGLQPTAATHAAAFAMAVLRDLPADFAVEPAPRVGAEEADEAGAGWRRLGEPLPAVWPRDLGVPPPRGAAMLELCLLPVVPQQPLTLRSLASLPAELAALGRAANVFGPAEEVSEASDQAAVVATAQAGFGVTRRHERCGWQPLPRDSLGSVLDEEDLTSRLAALLTVLSTINVPPPRQAAVAVGVTPSVMLAEGRVDDMPRTSRGRTSLTPLRIAAADAVPWEQLAGTPADVAAELAGRLLAAFRSRQAGTRR
jgi:nucleoside phosphorylase